MKHEAVEFLYCAGVLVTIPDAKAGFRTLATMLKPGGRYFIWMYHPFDKRHHPNDHRTVALHSWVRERITSRLPIGIQQALYLALVPLYMLKRTLGNLFRAEKNRTTWREKMQDFTDDLSPMYQHRYAEEEILRLVRGTGVLKCDHCLPGAIWFWRAWREAGVRARFSLSVAYHAMAG